MRLIAERVPLPPLRSIDGLLARQFGPRLQQLQANPNEFTPLIDCLRFVDERGHHAFDACLFRLEDGPVFKAGTTEVVACFSQSAATECEDEVLAESLEAALKAFQVDQFRRGVAGGGPDR